MVKIDQPHTLVLKKATHLIPIFFALLLLVSNNAYAQINIQIKGKVTDAETGEALPFSTVFVEGKFNGTTADIDGNYKLEVSKRADSLSASALGYETMRMLISKSGGDQILNFAMKRPSKGGTNIETVTIGSNENLTAEERLLRRIIRNKDKNNYKHLPDARYKTYTKYQIDLAEFTVKPVDKNKLFKLFPVLKTYIDSINDLGKPTLPIFFVENFSDNYIVQNPRREHEIIHAIKISGIQKEDFITQLLSSANQNLNIYENLMGVLGKSLVSPIADYGMSVYKYNLDIYDTIIIGPEKYLKMTFKPRHKDDYAFKGQMLVNLSTFAVDTIDMTLNEDINIGFIKEFGYKAKFQKFTYKQGDSTINTLIPKREVLRMTFNYNLGGASKVIAHKTEVYSEMAANQVLPKGAVSAVERTSIDDSAYTRGAGYWDSIRTEVKSATESRIDTELAVLKQTPRFKIILGTFKTFASGYVPAGKVEFGHIASIISGNDVEKIRIKLGMRTTKYLSERFQLDGYAAYGFKDNRVKYGGKAIFIISRKPWNKLTLSARTDVDFKSKHAEEFDQDNLFTIVSKPNAVSRFYNVEEFKIDYESDFHRDLTFNFSALRNRFKPYFDFSYQLDNVTRRDVTLSELDFGFRWQYGQSLLPTVFYRESKASKFFNQFRKANNAPILRFQYTLGLRGVINSDFTYHNLALGIQGDVQITAKMSMYYNFWGGKILNTVPWLLLKFPEGNFSFVHNKYYFNDMNLLEFAADRYLSLNWQYHFGGLLFDKIPGFRKLKWREVITANVFYGDVSNANKQFNSFESAHPFSIASPIPYAEAGVGIENIFKFLRVDSIWRLTHRDNKNVLNWSLYLSLFIKV